MGDEQSYEIKLMQKMVYKSHIHSWEIEVTEIFKKLRNYAVIIISVYTFLLLQAQNFLSSFFIALI